MLFVNLSTIFSARHYPRPATGLTEQYARKSTITWHKTITNMTKHLDLHIIPYFTGRCICTQCAVSVRVTHSTVPPRPHPPLELFLRADRKPWEAVKALMTSSTIALQRCHPTARSAEPAPRPGWCMAAVEHRFSQYFIISLHPHTSYTHTHTHTHTHTLWVRAKKAI